MFNGAGSGSMQTLRLGNKFTIPTSATDIKLVFRNCGVNDGNMRVYVHSEDVKTQITSLATQQDVPEDEGSVPALWKSNANIIIVE